MCTHTHSLSHIHSLFRSFDSFKVYFVTAVYLFPSGSFYVFDSSQLCIFCLSRQNYICRYVGECPALHHCLLTVLRNVITYNIWHRFSYFIVYYRLNDLHCSEVHAVLRCVFSYTCSLPHRRVHEIKRTYLASCIHGLFMI